MPFPAIRGKKKHAVKIHFRAADQISFPSIPQQVPMSEFFKFVESDLKNDLPEMASSRVIPSLLDSAERNSFSEISEETLAIWVVDMLLHGKSLSTSRRYLGTLHTLFKKWYAGNPEADAPFIIIKERLASVSEPLISLPQENLKKLPRLLKRNRDASDFVIVNAILYLFYNVSATIPEVVNLKFSESESDCQQIQDIIEESRIAPNSRYVFPLEQGKKRDARIAKDLISAIHSTLRLAGLEFNGEFSRESISEMWIAAALAAGISPLLIRSAFKKLPSSYSFLSILPEKSLGPGQLTAMICRVADWFNAKTIRWFVMRLRPRVSPHDLREAVENRDPGRFSEIDWYYPTHTEVIKENRKLIKREVPYLPEILFFRLRSDHVANLMRLIGDLAWCYRVTNNPESPYSSISRREMAAFQRHIGALTPDIEMELVTTSPTLAIGDKVRVNGGGIFDGREGIIRKVRNHDGTTTFTLSLSDTASIRWSDVTLPAAYLEPA